MSFVNSFKGHAALLLASCRRWNNGFITAAILIRAHSLRICPPHDARAHMRIHTCARTHKHTYTQTHTLLQRPPTSPRWNWLIIHSWPEMVNSSEQSRAPPPHNLLPPPPTSSHLFSTSSDLLLPSSSTYCSFLPPLTFLFVYLNSASWFIRKRSREGSRGGGGVWTLISSFSLVAPRNHF